MESTCIYLGTSKVQYLLAGGLDIELVFRAGWLYVTLGLFNIRLTFCPCRKKEEEAKRRLLENPIKMKQLEKLVKWQSCGTLYVQWSVPAFKTTS